MDNERLSRFDNLHILFWLIKDMSWCLMSKTIGTMMIIPTVTVALIILYRSRLHLSSFIHNLSVLFWIAANSLWMLGEMYCADCTKPYAIWIFVAGTSILLGFYLYAFMKRLRRT